MLEIGGVAVPDIYVYALVHKPTNMAYIGITDDVKMSRSRHFSALKYSRHVNKFLQFAYNKSSGVEEWEFRVLEVVRGFIEAELREWYYINTWGFVFNIDKYRIIETWDAEDGRKYGWAWCGGWEDELKIGKGKTRRIAENEMEKIKLEIDNKINKAKYGIYWQL